MGMAPIAVPVKHAAMILIVNRKRARSEASNATRFRSAFSRSRSRQLATVG